MSLLFSTTFLWNETEAENQGAFVKRRSPGSKNCNLDEMAVLTVFVGLRGGKAMCMYIDVPSKSC